MLLLCNEHNISFVYYNFVGINFVVKLFIMKIYYYNIQKVICYLLLCFGKKRKTVGVPLVYYFFASRTILLLTESLLKLKLNGSFFSSLLAILFHFSVFLKKYSIYIKATISLYYTFLIMFYSKKDY